MPSPDPRRGRLLWLGLLLAALSTAPAPPAVDAPKPVKRSAIAEARAKAAARQFEEVWTFYRQSRTDSFPVYYWSRLVFDSQNDLSATKAERVTAAEGHRERMLRLETLVKKVRRIGFGFSVDVGATEYYRLEADRWLEQAKAE